MGSGVEFGRVTPARRQGWLGVNMARSNPHSGRMAFSSVRCSGVGPSNHPWRDLLPVFTIARSFRIFRIHLNRLHVSPWLWVSLSSTRNGCEATCLLDLEIAPGLKVLGHVKAPGSLFWPSHSLGVLKFRAWWDFPESYSLPIQTWPFAFVNRLRCNCQSWCTLSPRVVGDSSKASAGDHEHSCSM